MIYLWLMGMIPFLAFYYPYLLYLEQRFPEAFSLNKKEMFIKALIGTLIWPGLLVVLILSYIYYWSQK